MEGWESRLGYTYMHAKNIAIGINLSSNYLSSSEFSSSPRSADPTCLLARGDTGRVV